MIFQFFKSVKIHVVNVHTYLTLIVVILVVNITLIRQYWLHLLQAHLPLQQQLLLLPLQPQQQQQQPGQLVGF